MIKAASVGLGWWSDELAKSIQGKSKEIKIVSCYSKSKKKRIDFSKKYKTIYHDSFKAILRDPKIKRIIAANSKMIARGSGMPRSVIVLTTEENLIIFTGTAFTKIATKQILPRMSIDFRDIR